MTETWLEVIYFAGALGGGAFSTALAYLFARRAAKSDGLFTGLTLIFAGLAFNYAVLAITAWISGDLPEAKLPGAISRWIVVGGEAFLLRALLRSP